MVDKNDLVYPGTFVYPVSCTPVPGFTRPGYRCGAAPLAGPVKSAPQFEPFYTDPVGRKFCDLERYRMIDKEYTKLIGRN